MFKREVVWTKNSEFNCKKFLNSSLKETEADEIPENRIVILKVWDCRQNPDKLNIPR
jgi:hypothetical protein